MLERFIEKKHTIDRLRSSPFAEHLDGFAAAMFAAGYSRSSATRYVNAAAHLGHWCRDRHLPVAQIDDRTVRRFVEHIGRRCRCPDSTRDRVRETRSGARRFLEYLRERGLVSVAVTTELPGIVSEFCEWMRACRGVAESTLATYVPLVTEFLRREGRPPEPYNAAAVRAFILRRSRGCGTDRARTAVTALRMFLTFLSASGRCSPALIGAVPTLASWRLAKLPRHISAAEVEKVVAVFDATTVKGARDRAMLLLMARLGLRVGEVATLRLADFDWDRGRLHVTGKGRVESWLPLPQQVGDAVLRYIVGKRPPNADDHVFVRVRPPRRLLDPRSISFACSTAMRAAGIDSRFHGAHVLRHSLATDLLSKGASLAQIGVVLRHRSTATTEIYAKVDLTTLQRVAQPWPSMDVSPC
jgi:integrase/recombinase XerD